MAETKKPKTKAPAKTTNQQGKRQIGKEGRENATKKLTRTSTAGQGQPPLLKGSMRPSPATRTRAN